MPSNDSGQFGTSRGAQRSRAAAQAPAPDTLTPADRYQELFTAVQQSGIFSDSKTFVDCAPQGAPAAILAAYRARCRDPGFDLSDFVHANFKPTHPPASEYVSVPGQPIGDHIESLWNVLNRHPRVHPPHASLLQLPHPYVVPGGRFAELYYWDSYFTMLGLAGAGHVQMMGDMVHNFAYLIDTYGHIPNGTRTYYLSRSQPPVFALMVELAQRHGAAADTEFLPQLRQEHAYWMAGSDGLASGEARRRVVRLRDGRLLNRYWDDRDTPREEAWLEDVATVQACRRQPAEVYRDLRAACESGWDFSTRWLREAPSPRRDGPVPFHARAATAPSLTSICTTDMLPVDLNAFLYKLETKIAEVARHSGDAATAGEFAQRARERRAALIELCWDDGQAAFFDYDWRSEARRTCLTAASVVPLFVGLAEPAHAQALATTVSARMLAPGGLSTTDCWSDQQWDRPNGWAPLQWMGIRGFAAYGCRSLSNAISRRWLATVAAVYEREGKLVEKYALRSGKREHSSGGGGGEYPLQDGFGWTNGVASALLKAQPGHSAQRCVSHDPAPRHR